MYISVLCVHIYDVQVYDVQVRANKCLALALALDDIIVYTQVQSTYVHRSSSIYVRVRCTYRTFRLYDGPTTALQCAVLLRYECVRGVCCSSFSSGRPAYYMVHCTMGMYKYIVHRCTSYSGHPHMIRAHRGTMYWYIITSAQA